MFNVENKFRTVANKMADVVILGIAYLLTSLPIVTVGAAFAAFWHVVLQIAEDQEESAADRLISRSARS